MKKTIWRAAILTGMMAAAVTGCSFKDASVTESPAVSAQETAEPSKETETEKESKPEPSTISPFPGDGETVAIEPPKEVFTNGCKLILASDIHYLAKDQTDFGDGFTYMVEHGDGKVVQYIWQITDAFLAQVIEEKPDALILSGDLTLNGEKAGHLELARLLYKVEEAGIPVLVIPGNHDINNGHAAYFEGPSRVKAASIGPEEFAEIYKDFGYDQAVSRDPSSLSYVYQIDEFNRALMLDSCQYENGNRVGGLIREDTYDWIEQQMEDAWDEGMNVIPVAHHNLLDESEVYVEDCTIEHSGRLAEQLESWQTPLFLSGHLHVQHFKRAYEAEGIYEIVTSSLATPPCQYGILYYGDDGSFRYHTKPVDMEKWARDHGSRDENLLGFKKFGVGFLNKVFYNQAQDEFARQAFMKDVPGSRKDEMAKVYAALNSACYAGKVVDVREQETKKAGYRMWDEYGSPSILAQYLEWIVEDGVQDYNSLESSE